MHHNPTGGALWGAGTGRKKTPRARTERGPTPPQSSKAEVYVPPAEKMPLPGSGGVAIDSKGVVWQNWRGAHQMKSFAQRKGKARKAPKATRAHRPEGGAGYKTPAPAVQG